MCGFGHGIKSLGALMFKDTCTVGKMLRSNHGTLAPLSQASWDTRVRNDLCTKRKFVYVSILSLKKRNKKKKLICVSWLSSGFWFRQHDPFFYQVLVSGWYWTTSSLTHSINQSIKLLTQSIKHTHSPTHLI